MLDTEHFGKDPFGYALLAWQKWGLLLSQNGFPTDISGFPTSRELKNPILWLSHAIALEDAAVTLIRNPSQFSQIDPGLRSICESQFYAVALMLIGYSLEVCLKAIALMEIGAEQFEALEKSYHHHNLNELSKFVPDLSEKDRAILEGLSHFIRWAGRYPDPGSKFSTNTERVFELSESFKISGQDVFSLASKVMGHAKTITG